MLVTLDFETYFDTKVSLTKLTTMDYVRHERFKVWGVGIKINHDETEWFGEDEAEEAIHAMINDKFRALNAEEQFQELKKQREASYYED